MTTYSFKDILIWKEASQFESSAWRYSNSLPTKQKNYGIKLYTHAHLIPSVLEAGFKKKSSVALLNSCNEALEILVKCHNYLNLTEHQSKIDLNHEYEALKAHLTSFSHRLQTQFNLERKHNVSL